MKSEKKASVFRLSATLFLITALIAAGLAGVNAITKGPIADAAAEKTQQAVAQVLGDCSDAQAIDFEDESGRIQQVFSASAGYAVEVAVPGFNGEIRMMVGIDREGNVLGISIISHTETAGLGAVAGADNAKGQAFRAQFIGLSGTLAVRKDGGTVDSITGATITSRAVTEGVNTALEWVRTFEKEVVA